MPLKSYRDLAEFGLPLITPDDPVFAGLVHEIETRTQPFESHPGGDSDAAAVLSNKSGQAIVVLSYAWRYTGTDGATRTSRFSTFGSSMQIDVLSGQSQPVRDPGSFILPGSTRLITEQGTFGNNLDVLRPDELPSHRGGYVSAGGGRGPGRDITRERIAAIELALDLAVLEDGLCVGRNEFGVFEGLAEGLERQRTAAEEAMKTLRNGASPGSVFDLIRPLAQHVPPPPGSTRPDPLSLTSMFANMAIHQLLHASTSELLSWFEQYSRPLPLQLRRPER